MSDKVAIPDDFFAPIAIEAPQHGLIYHDGPVIRCVAMTPIEEFEGRLPRMDVPASEALAFLTGERDTSDWLVWTDAVGETALLHVAGGMRIGGSDTLGPDYHAVPMGVPEGVFRIKMVVSSEQGRVSFTYKAPPIVTTVVEASELRVIVAEEEDPSSVLAILSAPLHDLVTSRVVVCPLPEAIRRRKVTYLTNFRSRMIGFGMVVSGEAGGEIPLPYGRFVDLAAFVEDDGKPCLLAVRREGRVAFSLRGGGGAIYERDMSKLPVVMARSDDPAELLTGVMLDVSSLLAGETVEAPLPPDTVTLHAPLLFASMRIAAT